MKPVDFRDETFERLRSGMEGARRAVYHAWVVHGPGTTRECAGRCGIDLLTLRPRTTELVEIGLVRCVGGRNGEGEYRAASPEEWEDFRRAQVDGQMQLI